MSIKRARRSLDPFTKIDNRAVAHGGLSLGALGVLAYVLSKPDAWTVQIEDLKKRFGIGRNKAYSLLRELIDHGWAERVSKRRLQNGSRFDGTEFVVFDQPHHAGPRVPVSGMRETGTLVRTERLVRRLSSKEESESLRIDLPGGGTEVSVGGGRAKLGRGRITRPDLDDFSDFDDAWGNA